MYATSLSVPIQELADRQNRSNTSDRDCVNVQTVQELRRLADESSIYRQAPYNRVRNRSNFHVSVAGATDGGALSWYAAPTRSSYDSMDDDDYDDVSANEHVVSIEGTRLDSSHLYDVYRQGPLFRNRQAHTLHPIRDRNGVATGAMFGIPTVQATSSTVAGPGASLPSVSSSSSNRPAPLSRVPGSGFVSRPHHIRRARPRVSEFSDFTLRRRNVQRPSAIDDPRAQEPSSSTLEGINAVVSVRSPLQTVPPIIPPPPSSSTSPISPTSPPPPPDVLQVIAQNGPSLTSVGRTSHGTSSSTVAEGDAAPGSNLFYSTALTNSLTRANSFSDRRLPIPRGVFHNYVPPPAPDALQYRPQFREEPSVLRPPSEAELAAAMFRDDFERDFGVWFSSGADDTARPPNTGPVETTSAQQTIAGAVRETSEPAVNLPTPRSISPPENP